MSIDPIEVGASAAHAFFQRESGIPRGSWGTRSPDVQRRWIALAKATIDAYEAAKVSIPSSEDRSKGEQT